jgi:hypothetical protein
VTGRSSSAIQPVRDRKVVFGYSASIRVKFRASQLYQARGYSSYELSLEPEASEILFDNKTAGIGQRLIAAFKEPRHCNDKAGI